jgi:aryl-alcohol dehydrogenase-like predicted oxidoreductase
MIPNRVIYGAGKLHHLPTIVARQNLIEVAYNVGFRSFDVAPSYGNGINELEIGIALRKKRHTCELNTKFGIPIEIYGSWTRYCFSLRRLVDKVSGSSANAYQRRVFSAQELESSLDHSLRRLQTDFIDTLFVHEPLSAISPKQLDEMFESSQRMKQRGKIRAFGIAGRIESIHHCSSIEVFDVIQLPYADFKRTNTNFINKRVNLYEVYQAYKGQQGAPNFARYVKTALGSHSNMSVILSSNSVRTVRSFDEIF